MDFIEQLPRSAGIYDAILVIVDRLTKMGIFIPTHTGITAEELAKIFLSNVFAKHGLPADIISDRGSEFTSEFWRSLSAALGIKLNHSTAYHPETDGQTERVNQSLEQYLRVYCNYQQDDWSTLLPMAEFAYNNATHSATQVSPFFANKGYHPTLQVSADPRPTNPSFDMANSLSTLHTYLQEQIKITQDQTKAKVNPHRTPSPLYKVGDKVWLSAAHIKTARPTKKLDDKFLGPFPISQQISSHAYKLELPHSMHLIHPVFHVNLLEPFHPNTIPHRQQPPPPPIVIAGTPEYEVAEVVDSKLDGRRRPPLMYRVRWKGYEAEGEEFTWEPASNLQNALDLVRAFHDRYPHKPAPS
jgi:hypothetical protein